MKNAIIAAVVAAVVASGGSYAATRSFISRTIVVRSPVTSVDAGARAWASASCPFGSIATGGGLTSSDISGNAVTITDSAPSPISTSKSPVGWDVAVQNSSFSPAQFQAYAVCVR